MVSARLAGVGPLSHNWGLEVGSWLSDQQDSLDLTLWLRMARKQRTSAQNWNSAPSVSFYWSKPVLRPLIQGEGNISIVLI